MIFRLIKLKIFCFHHSKKEPDSSKRLMDKNLESISGNNETDVEVSDGIDQELVKKLSNY